MRRRDFVRLMALLGLTPTAAQLAACDDDLSGASAADAGSLSDAFADAGGDVGADASGPDIVVPDDLPDYGYDGPPGPEALFVAGVASGDPLPDAVILWTYVEAGDEAPVDVWWEIALDAGFEQRLQVGEGVARAEDGHTFKVDVTGLAPGITYYYRFFALGRPSPVGRTRTAPVGRVDHLRFAVVSCSSYTSGFFHAYQAIAERADLDAVLHLGDYIYEGGGTSSGLTPERAHEPRKEIETIEEYRARYRQYRLDPMLAEVHRQHPFVNVWDDHESKNNAWREGAPAFGGTAEEWGVRKRVAWQAMMEWLPIRDQGEELKIWRSLAFGDLAELVMLDTRIWDRDEQADGLASPDMSDPDRSLLGEEQAAWLEERLCTSDATWKIVGQQVMMGQLTFGGAPINPDQWDGYPGSRDRLLRSLADCGAENVVVLTGDIHTSWGNEIALDPFGDDYDPETGEGALAVEYVCTSVTSQSVDVFSVVESIIDELIEQNRHMKYVDLSRRGYLLLDVTPERTQGAWFHFDTVREADRATVNEAFSAGFSCPVGRAQLVEDAEPAPGKATAPDLAPG